MLLVTVGLVLTLLGLIYLFFIWNYSYWKKLCVSGPKPQLIYGNYPGLSGQKRHMVYDLDDIYRKYKKDEDFVGIYNGRNPQLLITSPALARRVYVTDFKHFNANEASQMVGEKSDFVIANNPYCLTGRKWEEKRAEIIPGLTLGRVKTMYPVTNRICKRMIRYIKEETGMAPKDGLDGKDLCLRFTSEVITNCVLGLNANSFGNRPSPILTMVTNKMIDNSYKLVPKQTEEFFKCLMENGIDFCKSQTQKPHSYRIDFLDDMLQLQENKQLSTSQLTAHTVIFLLKGCENISSLISHCLLLLARHPSIQEKVRSEFEGQLDEIGVVNFDALVELPLLDACIHETLRIFPPGFYSNKICTESIKLTNKNGHTLHVREGEIIVMPLYSLMMDEDYYPNPQEFQPERFLEENGGVKKYRESGVFFGFGDGPRGCLGIDFALVQSKAAVVSILGTFNIRVNPKTRKDNLLNPKRFYMQLDGGIWLDFEARN